MKVQQAIDRIKELESMGELSGIFDDRGKFIYITEDEMNKVVDFIKQRGRVSIQELARESNRLIKLDPNEDDQIEEEIHIH